MNPEEIVKTYFDRWNAYARCCLLRYKTETEAFPLGVF